MGDLSVGGKAYVAVISLIQTILLGGAWVLLAKALDEKGTTDSEARGYAIWGFACIGGALLLFLLAYAVPILVRRLYHKAFPPPVNPLPGLTILEAWYGVENENTTEVTAFLRQKVHGDALHAWSSHAHLGPILDPVEGTHKMLKIRYVLDSVVHEQTWPEGQEVVIPNDSG